MLGITSHVEVYYSLIRKVDTYINLYYSLKNPYALSYGQYKKEQTLDRSNLPSHTSY